MTFEVKIEEGNLVGFSTGAREQLREEGAGYLDIIIEEANRIEAGRNSTKGAPEITAGMVRDAIIVQRQGLGRTRSSVTNKLLRVVSAVLSMTVGFMYDPVALQSQQYLLVFVGLIALTILAVTIPIFKE